MAKMRIAPPERIAVKLQCLRLLATLRLDPARMQLISGFIDTYLKLSPEEKQQFQIELGNIEPMEQEGVMQIVTSWMEEGIQQGKQALVRRLLTRLFGTLDLELDRQISQLSPEQVENLAEALFDFSDIADLRVWLSSNQSN